MARIRAAISGRVPIDFVGLEVYRVVRRHLDTHGGFGGLPPRLRQAFNRQFPRSVRAVIVRRIARETRKLTTRQIAWLQVHALLATGAMPWHRFAPTRTEIDAFGFLPHSSRVRARAEEALKRWGGLHTALGQDLGYLRTKPQDEPSFDDAEQRRQWFVTRSNALRQIHRALRRLDDHPRTGSTDWDAAYLLGVSRRSAIYLRVKVEKTLGRIAQVQRPRRG
ncbi:hypothetical protein HQ590_14085 [bacterium]|nr:hypothetical protein [bacterium]